MMQKKFTKKNMQNIYAVWMDQKRAFIIQANQMGDISIAECESDVEPKRKSSDRAGEQFTIVNQNKQNERRGNEMHAFTKELVLKLTQADAIWICGPGNAKFDLKHEVERNKSLAQKLKGVETCDKMTEAELKDYIRSKLPL